MWDGEPKPTYLYFLKKKLRRRSEKFWILLLAEKQAVLLMANIINVYMKIITNIYNGKLKPFKKSHLHHFSYSVLDKEYQIIVKIVSTLKMIIIIGKIFSERRKNNGTSYLHMTSDPLERSVISYIHGQFVIMDEKSNVADAVKWMNKKNAEESSLLITGKTQWHYNRQ